MFTALNIWMASFSVIGGGLGSCLREGLDLRLAGQRGTLSMNAVDILFDGEYFCGGV